MKNHQKNSCAWTQLAWRCGDVRAGASWIAEAVSMLRSRCWSTGCGRLFAGHPALTRVLTYDTKGRHAGLSGNGRWPGSCGGKASIWQYCFRMRSRAS
jgi:hypothetical protein